MNLEEVLAKARKKKLETEETERTRRSHELKLELAELSRKQKSAEIQNSTYLKDRLETQKKLGELKALKEFVDVQEYDEAETSLLNDLNELEEKLQGHKSLMEGLSQKISSLSLSISSVLNTKTLSSDFSEDGYITSAYGKSRDSIQQAYDEVKGLKDLLKSCGGNLKLVNCNCRIAAGNLRVLQDEVEPKPTPAEQVLLRRSFGIVGGLTKEYMCGMVMALSRDRKEDWRQYVNQARLERDRWLSSKQSIQQTNQESAEVKNEVKKEKLEIHPELASRLAGKKVSFFGGEEVAALLRFAEEDLGARKAVWYEGKDKGFEALMNSISCGGPDVVVMMNGWSSHGHTKPLVTACKKNDIPIAQLSSSSKDALRDQLMVVFKIESEVA
jgi:hypothetical protein